MLKTVWRSHLSGFILVVSLGLLSSCGSATDKSLEDNLGQKNQYQDASGGFVWGQNDPKTGLHKEESSDLEVIKRQEEVIKRQEVEKARLEKEKEDIMRQKYYNEKLKRQ